MIAGVEEIERRIAVFEVPVVMPLVLPGAVALDEEIGPPDEETVAEVLRERRLQVVVEVQVPDGLDIHVPVYHRIRGFVREARNHRHPPLLPLQGFQFQDNLTRRIEPRLVRQLVGTRQSVPLQLFF